MARIAHLLVEAFNHNIDHGLRFGAPTIIDGDEIDNQKSQDKEHEHFAGKVIQGFTAIRDAYAATSQEPHAGPRRCS